MYAMGVFPEDSGMRVSEHYAEDLPGLLTYELTPGATAEVVEHLRICDACRSDLVEALADSYPAGAILPRRFAAGEPRVTARQVRRSDLIFACLVLLCCMAVITLAVLLR